jgi:hypothetical protein
MLAGPVEAGLDHLDLACVAVYVQRRGPDAGVGIFLEPLDLTAEVFVAGESGGAWAEAVQRPDPDARVWPPEPGKHGAGIDSCRPRNICGLDGCNRPETSAGKGRSHQAMYPPRGGDRDRSGCGGTGRRPDGDHRRSLRTRPAAPARRRRMTIRAPAASVASASPSPLRARALAVARPVASSGPAQQAAGASSSHRPPGRGRFPPLGTVTRRRCRRTGRRGGGRAWPRRRG